MPEPKPVRRSLLRAHQILRPGFGTEAAVYGTLLVSGLIAVSAVQGRTKSETVLITVIATVLVFWGAHVYAGTVARLGEERPHDEALPTGLKIAFRQSLRHSLGMLTSASIPALVLLAGTTRIIPDDAANDAALWTGVAILLILGYLAFLRRGSSQLVCIVGGLVTGSFGFMFVVMKGILH